MSSRLSVFVAIVGMIACVFGITSVVMWDLLVLAIALPVAVICMVLIVTKGY